VATNVTPADTLTEPVTTYEAEVSGTETTGMTVSMGWYVGIDVTTTVTT
jgi:hypothetical protein